MGHDMWFDRERRMGMELNDLSQDYNKLHKELKEVQEECAAVRAALDAANKRIAELEADAKLGAAVREMAEHKFAQLHYGPFWQLNRWNEQSMKWESNGWHETPEEALGLEPEEPQP